MKDVLTLFVSQDASTLAVLATQAGTGIPTLVKEGILFPAEPHHTHTVDKGFLWYSVFLFLTRGFCV